MAVYYKLANSGVIWEKIGDQIVMANLDSGRYCNVSEASGVVVWELMMMGCSLELIHQKMPQYFTNYDDFCIYLDYTTTLEQLLDHLIYEILDEDQIKEIIKYKKNRELQFYVADKMYQIKRTIPA